VNAGSLFSRDIICLVASYAGGSKNVSEVGVLLTVDAASSAFGAFDVVGGSRKVPTSGYGTARMDVRGPTTVKGATANSLTMS